jgi:hypothetical protein
MERPGIVSAIPVHLRPSALKLPPKKAKIIWREGPRLSILAAKASVSGFAQ